VWAWRWNASWAWHTSDPRGSEEGPLDLFRTITHCTHHGTGERAAHQHGHPEYGTDGHGFDREDAPARKEAQGQTAGPLHAPRRVECGDTHRHIADCAAADLHARDDTFARRHAPLEADDLGIPLAVARRVGEDLPHSRGRSTDRRGRDELVHHGSIRRRDVTYTLVARGGWTPCRCMESICSGA
jgi:hypothetical protein